jgi:hypothetical protein
VEIVSEFPLASDEDAPMTLAVTSKVPILCFSLRAGNNSNRNKSIRIDNITKESKQTSSNIRVYRQQDPIQTTKRNLPSLDAIQPGRVPTSNQIQSHGKSLGPIVDFGVPLNSHIPSIRVNLFYKGGWRYLLSRLFSC